MKPVRGLRHGYRALRRRTRVAHGALADRPWLTLAVVFPLAWVVIALVLAASGPVHWLWGAPPALFLSWLVLREPGPSSPRHWG